MDKTGVHVGWFIGCLFFGGAMGFLGKYAAEVTTTGKIHQEAHKANCGAYELDPATGRSVFKWSEPKLYLVPIAPTPGGKGDVEPQRGTPQDYNKKYLETMKGE
jgi:hypothetical protein